MNQMIDLFGREKSVIARHLRNVPNSGALARGQLSQEVQQLPPMALPTKSSVSNWTKTDGTSAACGRRGRPLTPALKPPQYSC